MRENSILRETEIGTYYTGPLDPAIKAMRDEYGEDLTVTTRGDGQVIVTEHRGATSDNPNQWGVGATAEEAWRYLIGTDFGPLDSTYDDEGYEDHQRAMLGLAPRMCERHGGPWGEDETCPDCTDESGQPRPGARRLGRVTPHATNE